MKPRFSIIIPAYNAEQCLGRCIESVIGQTYRSLEIILVEDGSLDHTREICEAYAKKDRRIHIVHMHHAGLIKARQTGLRAAYGEYCIWVDADDWIDPQYCAVMAKTIEEKHPDILCCGFFQHSSDTINRQLLPFSEGFFSRDRMEACLFPVLLGCDNQKSLPLSLWAKAIKRELLSVMLDLPPCNMLGEDIVTMAACLFRAQSVYMLKDCLYHYLIHDTSISHGKHVYDWEGPKIRSRFLKKHLDFNRFQLKQQIDKSTVIALYTVVSSQFRRKESHARILRDIRMHLKDVYYQEALHACVFQRSLSGKLKCFLLKYRLVHVICFLEMGKWIKKRGSGIHEKD